MAAVAQDAEGCNGLHEGLGLLRREASQAGRIMTFCNELDALLGGGIALGEVSEIYGEPGLGKTQICMQLAVDALLPRVVQGVQGEALYIDTEGSFLVPRLIEIADAAAAHLHSMAQRGENAKYRARAMEFSREAVLQGVQLVRASSTVRLLGALLTLDAHLRAHPQVRLVLIDSLSCHLRQEYADTARLPRFVTHLGQLLARVADKHNVAVVVVNQITTRLGDSRPGADNGRALQAPALGESWSHYPATRIALSRGSGFCIASLVKSPREAAGVA